MNAQCPKCFLIVELDAGRYPPWCKKCGVDLKPNEYLPVASRPLELPPDPEPGFDRVRVHHVAVTGTGPKNWLRGGDVVATPTAQPKPPPKRTPGVAKPGAAVVTSQTDAEQPAPKPKPAPVVKPEEELQIGMLHVAGIVLFLVGGVMAGSVWKSNKNFGEATGEVRMTDVKGAADTIFHTRRIQYVVNDVKYDCDPQSYNLDETVSLLYDVKDPAKASVGSKVSRFGWSVMVAVCGLGLLVAGIFQANRRQRERELAAPKSDF